MDDHQVLARPRPPDWEIRRFHLEEESSLARFVRQWEVIHRESQSLLQRELRDLELQRIRSESRRLEILQDNDQQQQGKRCVWPDEEQELGPRADSGEVLEAPPDQDSDLLSLSSSSEILWRERAVRLSRLVTESFQKENVHHRQAELLRKSGVESAPVEDLRSHIHRADNFVHMVLHNAPIIIAHQDKNLRYRFIYNRLSDIQPHKSTDMIGRRDDEFYTGPGAAESNALKMEVIARRLPAKREIVFSSPDFGMKAVLQVVEPVFSGSGDVIGINTIAFDVTEQALNREKEVQQREEAAVQRAMETELHSTLQITEETMRAKQLLATMSHEIRSPLSGVVSMAEILSTTSLNDEQRQLVDIMVSSGDLVLQLIDDMLSLSRLESGSLKAEAKRFRPREVVKNVLQMAVASAQSKSLILEGLVVDDVPFELIGDVLRLRQIFMNLINNAIKFTHKGIVGAVMRLMPPVNRPRPTSETPEPDMMWLHCEVFDTGIGIPEKSIPVVFNKYIQASTTHARQYGGTGLGLAICKQLLPGLNGFDVQLNFILPVFKVELMGGELNVASKENEGSTFSFTLPCKVSILKAGDDVKDALQSGYFKFTPASGLDQVVNALPYSQTFMESQKPEMTSSPKSTSDSDAGKDQEPKKEPAASSGSGPFQADRRPRILLAEDDKVNVMVARSMLKRLGIVPHVVGNGEEAFQAAQKSEYDLILMDICMPVMDGLEATKRIRELQASGVCKWTPIIAMTANALAEDVAECYASGMDFFVAKPATFKRLEHALKKFLSHLLAPAAEQ